METIGTLPEKFWYQYTLADTSSMLRQGDFKIKTSSNYKYVIGIAVINSISYVDTLLAVKQNGKNIINSIPLDFFRTNPMNNFIKQFFPVSLIAKGNDITFTVTKGGDIEVDAIPIMLLHSNVLPSLENNVQFYTHIKYLTANTEESTKIILPNNDIDIISGINIIMNDVTFSGKLSLRDNQNYFIKDIYSGCFPDAINIYKNKFIPVNIKYSDLYMDTFTKSPSLQLITTFKYIKKKTHGRNPRLHTDYRRDIRNR